MRCIRFALGMAILAPTVTTLAAHQSYKGDSLIGPVFGQATFDDLGDDTDLFGYEEADLIFEVPGKQGFATLAGPPDIQSYLCTSVGNRPLLWPRGGANQPLRIRQVDNGHFLTLEFVATVMRDTDPTVYLWIQLYENDVLAAEFDVDSHCGQLVGVRGLFDEVRLGAYETSSIRDSHDATAHNILAVDDVTYGDPLNPVAVYFDEVDFDVAVDASGYGTVASWDFTPNNLTPGTAVALDGPTLDILTHITDPDDPWREGPDDLWPIALDDLQFATNDTPGTGSLTPVGSNALGFFTPGTLPDTDRTMLIDNFLSKSFVIISSAPVDGCHNALKFEMATVVGIAGEPVDLQVTVFDETDVVIRIVQISYVTGEHPFIGLFRPSGARIGRIDLWDRNGQAEGIVSLAGYRTRPCPDPNSDGTIDILDILVVLSEFGNESGPADVNSDGVVDVVDILYILAFWGTSCPICPVG